MAAPSHSQLHYAILRRIVDEGYAPTCAELAEEFAVDRAEMAEALRGLADYHGVVLHPHQPEVWVIHPFATSATPFVVRQGDRLWWGNCAWCSLGVAALLGGDQVTISTTLGAEGQPVTIHVDQQRVREELWVHFPVPMARAWDNVIYTCANMLVFDAEAAIDPWCQRHAIPRGSAQPIQRVYDFAAVWYGRHLDPDWRKWTVEEARALFAQFGFEGPIWQLPDASGRF